MKNILHWHVEKKAWNNLKIKTDGPKPTRKARPESNSDSSYPLKILLWRDWSGVDYANESLWLWFLFLAEINHFQHYRVGDFAVYMKNFLQQQIAFHQEVRVS